MATQTPQSTPTASPSASPGKRQRRKSTATPAATPVSEPTVASEGEALNAGGEAAPARGKTRRTKAKAKAEAPAEEVLKVKCDQQHLAEALRLLKAVVPTKPLQPVLTFLWLQAENGALVISASDLSQTVQVTANAEVQQSGQILVHSKLIDVVASCVQGSVTLIGALEGKVTRVTVTDQNGGSTEFSRTELSPDDFPPLTVSPQTYQLPAKVLEAALRSVMTAASREDSRGPLNGVNVQFYPGAQLVCTATDGHQVAITTANMQGVGRQRRTPQPPEPAIDCTLRLDSVRELCKVLAQTKPEIAVEFGYQTDAKTSFFTVMLPGEITVTLVAKGVSMAFPNVDAVIARYDFTKTASLSRPELEVRLASLAAITEGQKPGVTLRFEGMLLLLQREDSEVKAQQSLVAHVDEACQGFAIGLNLFLFLQMVKALNSSDLMMKMGTTTSLIQVVATGEIKDGETTLETTFYLMPMEIKG